MCSDETVNRTYNDLSQEEITLFTQLALDNNKMNTWLKFMQGKISFDELLLIVKK